MEIRRGDIFFVKQNGWTPVGENSDTRPALVVSNDKANAVAPIVSVVWLTTQPKKPLPTHCKVIAREESTALCENINTINKERLLEYVKTATDREMEDVDACLRVALCLSEYVAQEPEEEAEWEEVVSPVDVLEEILESCNEIYLTETNDDVAEGIDCAARIIRGKLRRELTRG